MATQIKSKKAATRRSEIIDNATDLFLKNGFGGTSMADVAKASAMQKASLYYHFRAKEDLFAACITEGHASALDTLTKISIEPGASSKDKLERAIKNLYEINVRSKVGRMSPLIAEVSRTFPEVAKRFHQDFIMREEHLLRSIIDEGVSKGEFREMDPIAIRYMLNGPVVTLSLSREMFATFDDLEEHCPIDHIRDHHTAMMMQLLLK